MSGALHVEDLRVVLGGKAVLEGVGFDLPAGSYGVVLGPSGAGKSTLLRAVAGLLDAEGTIRIADRVVCSGRQVVSAEERPVGFLFQGLALWPHMTVRRHLEFALDGRRIRGEQRGRLIAETLGPLGIADLASRRPSQLSGGERQRLALARALVTRPDLLLLDEPTSSVDPRTAQEVQDLLSMINRTFGATVLHVTHDQEEALALGSRVFILDEGRLVQGGTPEEVYSRPEGLAAARFVGAGATLPGVVREGGRADTPLGQVALQAPPDAAASANGGARKGETVWLLLRPEDLAVVPEGDGVPVTVDRVTYRGGRWRARVQVAEQEVLVDTDEAPVVGEKIRIKVLKPLWTVATRSPA